MCEVITRLIMTFKTEIIYFACNTCIISAEHHQFARRVRASCCHSQWILRTTTSKMAIKSTHLLLFLVVCVAATTVIGKSINRDVTYEEVLQSTNNPNVLLVDVRRPDEIEETGIIPSAINIPLADFRNALSHTSNKSFLIKYNREKPDLDSHIIIYCTLGVRAQEALDIALELGYHNAKRYPGSWKEWAERQKADPTQIATS